MYKLALYFGSSGQDYFVLRDKRTNRILNIAPTEHGLTWTTAWNDKLVYYTNGKIKITPNYVYIVSSDKQPLNKSNDVYVERVQSGKMPSIHTL